MGKSYRWNAENPVARRIKTVKSFGKVSGQLASCGNDLTQDPKFYARLRFARRKGNNA
jgi:hypothetical protein